jgi:hypothetical protein
MTDSDLAGITRTVGTAGDATPNVLICCSQPRSDVVIAL